MPIDLSPAAPAVLRDYYRILADGPEAFGDGAPLRPLLSDHLDFTGPLAGHRPDATEGFLHGVAGFIATVRQIDLVQDIHDESGSAVLYDAVLPGGRVRLAEFLTVRNGVIDSLNLLYDGQDYIAKGGR